VKAARDGRAEWQAFPGFRGEVVASNGGAIARGGILVSADGTVECDLPESREFGWARKRIKSLISHRLPNAEREVNAAFADDDADHPLGRKILFPDDEQETVYRCQGDVLTEVHRTMGDVRFTLSVIEVARNAEGKHLPRSYTVGYWDKASGRLAHSDAFFYEWERVGRFDLPLRQLVIAVADGERTVQQLEFRRLELLDAPAPSTSE
jgi:hypothetical protein